ncbi:MAG: MATE family efflux transporter [Eubacteriales bacterium]|nr:MATE family efflux transporter [Eubacteriales bacterium]
MSLTEKPVLFDRKKLWNLIWPLVIEQLLTVLVGMVDVLMVAAVGEAAMSGVSLVDSISNLIIQVLFALTAGGTVVCAQHIGSGNEKKAGKTTAQLIFLSLAMTLVIMILFLIKGDGLLHFLFGKIDHDVMTNASTYLLYMAISYPFLALYHSGAAAFRAVGNTKISMLCSLCMNLFNIWGNAFCIFLLKMGVEGVAIPTLIARIFGAIFILWILQHKKQPASISSLSEIKPDGSIIRQILNIGIPNGLESGIFQFGKLSLQSLVSTLGTASIAGFAAASNLVTYFYLPGNALGAAMLTVVGQCYGAGQKDEAKRYAKILIVINYAMLAVICSIMIIGRSFFVGMYHLSPQASVLGIGLLLSHAIAMIIWPIGFLTPYYFRAIGKARFTMIVSITTMWLFRIGLAYVFICILGMNVLGIWYAMYVDWIVRVIVYIIAFQKEKG